MHNIANSQNCMQPQGSYHTYPIYHSKLEINNATKETCNRANLEVNGFGKEKWEVFAIDRHTNVVDMDAR